MLHPGMASELWKLESEERRRNAADHRAGRRDEHDQGVAAGAAGLLALAFLGPATAILVSAVVLAAVLLVAGRARFRTHAIVPEARDRWAAWRVVEPDAEYRRHAA